MADLKQILLVNDKLTKVDVTSDIQILQEVLSDITQNVDTDIQLKDYFESVLELFGLLSKFNFQKNTLILETKKELEKASLN